MSLQWIRRDNNFNPTIFHLVSRLWFLKMRGHIIQLNPGSSLNLLKKKFGIPYIELCVDDIRSLLSLSLSMQSLMILISEPHSNSGNSWRNCVRYRRESYIFQTRISTSVAKGEREEKTKETSPTTYHFKQLPNQ